MSDFLKNCPFCDAKPIYETVPYEGNSHVFNDAVIRCPQCKQSIVKASWYGGDLGLTEACWNKRHQDPLIVHRVNTWDAVTSALKRLHDAAVSPATEEEFEAAIQEAKQAINLAEGKE